MEQDLQKVGHMKPLRLVVLALAGSAALLAQLAPRATAEIPFAFEMANLKLPAGEYDVTSHSDKAYITVRNYAEKLSAIAIGFKINGGTAKTTAAKLVFNKYGDRYFLSEVWHPSMSQALPKSKSERAFVTCKLITAIPERVVIMARAF